MAHTYFENRYRGLACAGLIVKHDCPTRKKETDAERIYGVRVKKLGVVDVLKCKKCDKFTPIEPKESE